MKEDKHEAGEFIGKDKLVYKGEDGKVYAVPTPQSWEESFNERWNTELWGNKEEIRHFLRTEIQKAEERGRVDIIADLFDKVPADIYERIGREARLAERTALREKIEADMSRIPRKTEQITHNTYNDGKRDYAEELIDDL